MSADALRDALKSGPMAALYARLRHAKRRLRREPVAGPLLPENTPLGVEELRRLVPLLPDHARLLYSLGLRYLEHDGPDDMPKALACFRSAQTLGFESPERVALYQALIAAKSGRLEEAQRLILPLVPHELTIEENTLRKDIQQGRVEPLALEPTPADQEVTSAKSVLVIGDAAALTAGWFADAHYLLADPGVTGLPLEALPRLGLAFDVALGPREMREPALLAGVIFSQWRDL